jgi:hypothetical protein
MFDSTKEDLRDILESVHAGHLLAASAAISPYDPGTRDAAADWLAETADRYQSAVQSLLNSARIAS